MVNNPFVLGQRVIVAPHHKYAAEWYGEYFVVGLTWDYRLGGSEVNIAIATKQEISDRWGSTDGWSPDDLLPAT